MNPTFTALFRWALVCFPRSFRERYADEMVSVFAERCEERAGIMRLSFAFVEAGDALIAGARMRLSASAPRHAIVVFVSLGVVAMLFSIHGPINRAPRIDFSARDPAGDFTITIVGGRPVAATINSVRLPAERIVQKADSISLLASNGNVALAVAFDAPSNSIAWSPRAP